MATTHVLTHYPKEWNLITASLLAGSPQRGGTQIPSPFCLTSVCRVLDKEAERLKAETHRVRALQMAQTPLSTLTPYYHDKAKSWREAEESFQHHGGIEQVAHFLTTFTLTEHTALTTQVARGLARQLGGDWHPLTGLHPLGLMASLPLTCGPLLTDDMIVAGIMHPRTGAPATAGAPIVLDWQGTSPRIDRATPTPLITLVGRRGEIMPVDPFANRSGGYSMAIVGAPGSGKSLMMNEIAFATLLRGGVVWVIDVGHSYRKTCDLLSGEYLQFSETDVWNLNPLQLLSPGSVDRLDDVVSVLNELLMPAQRFTALERSALTQAIDRTVKWAHFEEHRTATLRDLDAFLAQSAVGDHRIADLRAMLTPYLGPFAKWFDGTGKPLTFQNRFTVLELEGLSGHPALRQTVLMMLMLIIDETMARDRTTIKAVLIDEAWDLMGKGQSGSFIESGFRRARKHKGSFVVATQALGDFWLSPTARAAWSCADTRFFLRQDTDQVATLMTRGDFVADEGFLATLKSLTTVAGQYSEILVQTGDCPPAVGRLTIDRLSQLLFSSNPAEVTAIQAWREAGADILTALQNVAAGRFAPARN